MMSSYLHGINLCKRISANTLYISSATELLITLIFNKPISELEIMTKHAMDPRVWNIIEGLFSIGYNKMYLAMSICFVILFQYLAPWLHVIYAACYSVEQQTTPKNRINIHVIQILHIWAHLYTSWACSREKGRENNIYNVLVVQTQIFVVILNGSLVIFSLSW